MQRLLRLQLQMVRATASGKFNDTGERSASFARECCLVRRFCYATRGHAGERYQKNLGLNLENWGGAILRWPDDKAEDGGLTVWNAADNDTKWFSPSESSFMINYRVDNLDELLDQLKQNGVEIVSGPESHENGTFAWIMDPDKNKVELWEPMILDEKNKK
jgi:predicted enzyme related to lactoylglutathione lyase